MPLSYTHQRLIPSLLVLWLPRSRGVRGVATVATAGEPEPAAAVDADAGVGDSEGEGVGVEEEQEAPPPPPPPAAFTATRHCSPKNSSSPIMAKVTPSTTTSTKPLVTMYMPDWTVDFATTSSFGENFMRRVCRKVWHGMVWCGGAVRCGAVWRGVTRRGVAW